MADSSSGSKQEYNKNNSARKQRRVESKDHIFKKRQPPKYHTAKSAIYVSSKSNIKVGT